MAPPEVVRLYRQVLRAAGTFTDYNFKQYFLRRAKEDFRVFEHRCQKGEVDLANQQAFMQAGLKHLGMLKRQGMISQMYESTPPTTAR
mmetsp:Transcript_18436/g.43333  ORF Transcript_18436/g.43333 Transcript_18436/m.43333 type:complete len:88 (-) Transcript_18436:105-368(-)|eukprot:CAMPEP_0171067732 /NCGR_PEP_ID=MMETSP0766_2-20121228/8165_1 /TAXON_ID=439317 /ORGANISM="Gambierdiscus australes, Strain CAWD 149" /LENGTH=87 /DNA_ID=CAMNT_0011523991 /DNA_START=174 /DNA_END=437 /DNA_ORIENTATION=-